MKGSAHKDTEIAVDKPANQININPKLCIPAGGNQPLVDLHLNWVYEHQKQSFYELRKESLIVSKNDRQKDGNSQADYDQWP